MRGLHEARGRLLVIGASTAVSAVALLAAPTAGAGGQAGYGCPTGFDPTPLTLQQALGLPKIQAGIQAGIGTQAGFAAFFNKADHNGNHLLCVKSNPVGNANGDPSNWVYSYNFSDDNSAAAG